VLPGLKSGRALVKKKKRKKRRKRRSSPVFIKKIKIIFS
jgi:hypothetical protein